VTGPLISADALAATLTATTVLDVRWDLQDGPRRDRYEAGHIPGAAFLDLDRDLAAPHGDGTRGRHPLPQPDAFAAAMRAAGVSTGRPVVVYDDAGATIAARAWWLLRHHGHPDVTVLDGGLRAWTDAGGALATGGESPEPGDFVAAPSVMDTLDAAAAAALARDGVLLDARPPERYRGETEPIDPVAGHIPGARSRPTRANVDDADRFRSVDELMRAFADVGVEPGGASVGAYCGSGVTAAHEVLALELVGVRAALYPGSWSEWSADPSRPVATGNA
jgi:thiosulfate/3-mercaptopyruvate sulfurtransferase